MLKLLIITSLSQLVLGQTETEAYSGGDFTITWTAPTTYDGNLDCEATTSSCKPLNADACSEVSDTSTARDIELSLNYTSSLVIITAGSQLYVWLQSGTGACTFDQVPELVAQHELTSTDTLVSGTTFDFPEDLDTTITFNTSTILNEDDACGETSVDETTYRLCFGIDLNGLSAVDNKVSTSEPHGYAEFKVDTAIPSVPLTPKLTALDGRIGIALESGSSSTNEIIEQWEVWVREKPESTTEDTEDTEDTLCDTWESTDVTVETINGLTDTTASTEISADNGKSYEICAYAIDALGNRSSASATKVVTPQEECDFLECYPGDLKTGYCGALPPINVFAWLNILYFGFLLRLRRKK